MNWIKTKIEMISWTKITLLIITYFINIPGKMPNDQASLCLTILYNSLRLLAILNYNSFVKHFATLCWISKSKHIYTISNPRRVSSPRSVPPHETRVNLNKFGASMKIYILQHYMMKCFAVMSQLLNTQWGRNHNWSKGHSIPQKAIPDLKEICRTEFYSTSQ